MPSAEEVRDAVLHLHRPFRIYTECDHDSVYDEETGEPTSESHGGRTPIAVEEIGWTCSDGLMYVACFECCTGGVGEYQSEECADHHEHSRDEGRRCETVQLLSGIFGTDSHD